MAIIKKEESCIMRGYQKKVIYLKNMNSSVFEEAYFVVKSNEDSDKSFKRADTTLLEEAKKIVEENSFSNFLKKRKRISKANVLIFGAGFISASISLILISYILKFI